MSILIQYRLDTAAQWTAINPVLAQGEPALETDTKREKIGDGVTPWVDLLYKSSSSSGLFDGEDTLSNIESLDPNNYQSQVWWATDKFSRIIPIADLDSSDGVGYWQLLDTEFSAKTNTFNFPTTNIGNKAEPSEEMYINVINSDVTDIIESEPQVVLGFGATIDDNFHTVSRAKASDIQDAATVGITTTNVISGKEGKATTYGFIKGVDTTGANAGETWLDNQILYINGVDGKLTNIKPAVNIFAVARIMKVDATTGMLFVNTISIRRLDLPTVLTQQGRIYFTGDADETYSTYLQVLFGDKGVVTDASQTAAVPNDSTIALTTDWLSPISDNGTTIDSGSRFAQLQVSHDSSGGQELYHIEVYQADEDGTPNDAGTYEPGGSLGVKPLFVYDSPRYDTEAGSLHDVELTAFVQDNYNVPAGKRLRFVLLCEKFGTGGGNKNMTIYYGSDRDSYLTTEIDIDSNAVHFQGQWVQQYYDLNDQAEIDGYTGIVVNPDGTEDVLKPELIGELRELYEGTGLVSTSASAHQIIFGQRVAPAFADYQVSEITLQTIIGNKYELFIVHDALTTPSYEYLVSFTATEEDSVFKKSFVFHKNTTTDIVALVSEPDAVTVDTHIEYNYLLTNSNTTPIAGQMTHAKNNADVLMVHKLDNVGTDRSAYFNSLLVGDKIKVSDTEWSIQNVVQNGDYFDISVEPATRLAASSFYMFTFSVVSLDTITYDVEVDYYLNTNVKGLFGKDISYENITLDDNAYGLNITFQEIRTSDDWYIISSPSGGLAHTPEQVDLLPLNNTWTGSNSFENPVFIGQTSKMFIELFNESYIVAPGSPDAFTAAGPDSNMGIMDIATGHGIFFMTDPGKVAITPDATLPALNNNGAPSAARSKSLPTIEWTIDKFALSLAPLTSSTSVTPVFPFRNILHQSTSASAITVTLEQGFYHDVRELAQITFLQDAGGQITFTGGSGVTIKSAETFKTRKEGSFVTAIWLSDEEVRLTGDLELL